MIDLTEEVKEEDKEKLLALLYGSVTKVFGDIYVTSNYDKLISIHYGTVILEEKFYSKILMQYLVMHNEYFLVVTASSGLYIFYKDGTEVIVLPHRNASINFLTIETVDDRTVIEYKNNISSTCITIDNNTQEIY